MSDTEYPSWRDAISDNDKIANIRCGLKYIFWHTAYLFLAALGLIVVTGAKLLDRIVGSSTASVVGRLLNTPTAKMVSRFAVNAFLLLGFVFIVVVVGLVAINNPIEFIIALGIFIGTVAVTVVAIILWEEAGPYVKQLLSTASKPIVNGASKAGAKAVETPGVRRVYGNCPVHMDLEPKWFENLFDQ